MNKSSLHKAANKIIKDQVGTKTFPVTCPHCNKEINVRPGKSNCPHCYGNIDLTVNIK